MPATSMRSDLLKGVRLGPYQVGALIGHGATASVFEAMHVALGKQVAVKVLHEHLASDEQLQSRFVREGSQHLAVKVAERARRHVAIEIEHSQQFALAR